MQQLISTPPLKPKLLTLGADPEFFIQKHSTGEIVSSVGMLGGNKFNPAALSREDPGFTVIEDNIMAEYTIPPSATKDAFTHNITQGIKLVLQHYMGRNNLSSDYTAHRKSVVYPPQEMLNNEQAMTFGCEPDRCAYTLMSKEPPSPTHIMRTAGGHIHLGFEGIDKGYNYAIVRALDAHIGLYSVLWDQDGQERRKMYGGAGSYRDKPYGLEYRSPSNFWIFSVGHIHRIYELAHQAFEFAIKYDFEIPYTEDIKEVVDDGLVGDAIGISQELGIKIPLPKEYAEYA